ncbi:MAG: hypothetical protein LRY41_01960 [Candidatus Pacebacteria bacterium]|nr:hypothetical protein [Candidatus Paceibacterota bacterium]MCD8507984.1 hypothetical protein [Candidatus Paceibacterota bacterium]MCD8528073.1 hypothetical protein [Candidatus Paceibacterota bacterium]MCD8564030.1 hypothetical protein [Candidatus Paceibacterota bacterium]
MLTQTWLEILKGSLQNFWFGVADFLPHLLLALIIFLIGWLVAELVKSAIVRLLELVKLNTLLAQTGLEKILEKAGYTLNAAVFFGWLIKWFIIIVFLIASLQIVGLSQVNMVLNSIVLYIPNIIAAALIMLAATLLGDVVRKIVVGSSKAVGSMSSSILGALAYWAIMIFAGLIALQQLGLAVQLINTLFIGFVAMIALAGGLAFGLGGRDAAKEAIEDMKKNIRS